MPRGQWFEITSVWENVSVTPHYERVIIKFKLYEPATGAAVWEGVSGLDLRDLLPGEPFTQVDVMELPRELFPGTYELRVKAVDPAFDRRSLRLAIEGLQINGSYTLGEVLVR